MWLLGSILVVIVILAVITISVFDLSIETRVQVDDDDDAKEIKTTDLSDIVESETTLEKKLEKSEPGQETLYFTVNVEGDTKNRGFLTISGTIPSEPRHLTGAITSGIGIDVRVVQVFQIQMDKDENTFSHKIGINDDYLWEEDTVYTVSVKHGNLTRNVEFYRGTFENNFEDSIVPLIT